MDIGLDMKGRDVFCMRSNDDPLLGPRVLDHMTAQEYVDHQYVAPWQQTNYYWFALTRCPVKRVLSTYNYFGMKMSLSRFVQEWIPKQFLARNEANNKDRGHHYFMRPQVEFITDGDGRLLVDDLIKLEDLCQATSMIADRTGLKSEITHANKSHMAKMTVDDFSRTDLDLISEIYIDDFEALGYAAP